MQRLSFSLIIALSLSATSSGVLAAELPTTNLIFFDRTDLISESNKTKTVSGSFVSVEHPTQGQAKISEIDGQRFLEFSQDFQSDRGPALKVILHQNSSVDLQIQPDSYASLGELQAVSGIQRYLIPDDIDLAAYESVAIWCERFNATFGYAPLAQ